MFLSTYCVILSYYHKQEIYVNFVQNILLHYLRSKLLENKKFLKSSEKVGSNLIAESLANPLIKEFGPPEFFSVTTPTLNKL